MSFPFIIKVFSPYCKHYFPGFIRGGAPDRILRGSLANTAKIIVFAFGLCYTDSIPKNTSDGDSMLKKNRTALLTNKDLIHAAICTIILCVLVCINLITNETMTVSEMFDLEMLTSVLFAFMSNSLAVFIVKRITISKEDCDKLNEDYDALVKRYDLNGKALTYENAAEANYRLGRKITGCKRMNTGEENRDRYKIAVGNIIPLHRRNVTIDFTARNRYTLPEFSQTHYHELLAAHGASVTYNQTTIRADDIEDTGNGVRLQCSLTTYYNALVTNRASDYDIQGVTVRELYAHGPFLYPLKDSRLSNHIGFNGMLMTKDGYFVFIKRHKNVSIGKNTLQCSVAASLKAKYAIADGKLTTGSIRNAIVKEIIDELKLNLYDKIQNDSDRLDKATVELLKKVKENPESLFSDFSFENNVLYFYRDFLESGKPQFMFFYKVDIDAKTLEKIYTYNTRQRRQRKQSPQELCNADGYKMILIPKTDIRKLYLTSDTIVVGNKAYKSVPSAVGTVVMMLDAAASGMITI